MARTVFLDKNGQVVGAEVEAPDGSKQSVPADQVGQSQPGDVYQTVPEEKKAQPNAAGKGYQHNFFGGLETFTSKIFINKNGDVRGVEQEGPFGGDGMSVPEENLPEEEKKCVQQPLPQPDKTGGAKNKKTNEKNDLPQQEVVVVDEEPKPTAQEKRPAPKPSEMSKMNRGTNAAASSQPKPAPDIANSAARSEAAKTEKPEQAKAPEPAHQPDKRAETAAADAQKRASTEPSVADETAKGRNSVPSQSADSARAAKKDNTGAKQTTGATEHSGGENSAGVKTAEAQTESNKVEAKKREADEKANLKKEEAAKGETAKAAAATAKKQEAAEQPRQTHKGEAAAKQPAETAAFNHSAPAPTAKTHGGTSNNSETPSTPKANTAGAPIADGAHQTEAAGSFPSPMTTAQAAAKAGAESSTTAGMTAHAAGAATTTGGEKVTAPRQEGESSQSGRQGKDDGQNGDGGENGRRNKQNEPEYPEAED